VAEAMFWHPFEYRHVPLEKTPASAGSAVTVSLLVNFDGGANVIADATTSSRDAIRDALEDYIVHGTNDVKEYDLESMADEQDVAELEYRTWIEVDQMIRLLTKAAPYQDGIPIPTQMLELMPQKPPAPHKDWPKEFALHKFVSRLESDQDARKFVSRLESDQNTMIGTASSIPFVHVGMNKGKYDAYPGLRRAQRLSFVIWVLLEQILVDGDQTMSRQMILETDSIAERLRSSMVMMRKISTILGQMIVERDI